MFWAPIPIQGNEDMSGYDTVITTLNYYVSKPWWIYEYT